MNRSGPKKAAMAQTPETDIDYRFSPLTAELWPDLEKVFGKKGAMRGCWCMRWRISRLQFEQQRGERNQRMLRKGVERGLVNGIIAYADDEPVGWCSIGPRENFPELENSSVLARVDRKPVWAVVCFFILRPHRGRRLPVALLQAAVEFAREQGAVAVEGYPIVPRQGRLPVAATWTGMESTFIEAGFKAVERRVYVRPIVRFYLPRERREGTFDLIANRSFPRIRACPHAGGDGNPCDLVIPAQAGIQWP